MDNQISSASYFLENNSLIMKVSVLLLIAIIFVIIFRVGFILLGYIFSIDTNPKLIKGIKVGKKAMVIRQDPIYKDSVPILRSKDEDNGIEFTWSVWLMIDDIEYLKNQHRHIFHKGNLNIKTASDDMERNGVNFPNNAPGLYIRPNSNDLLVIMNTFSNINEELVVKRVPVNKWFNVMIRVEGRNVDVYINGLVVVRRKLNEVPKQNYGDVHVNTNGGFSGYLSDLQYFNYAVNVIDVNRIMRRGPNLNTNKKSIEISNPPYLSLDWFIHNEI